MKKTTFLLLVCLLMASIFIGCTDEKVINDTYDPNATPAMDAVV